MEQTERDAVVEANRREYGEAYGHMRWVEPDEAARAEEERSRQIRALAGGVEWGFGATKLDCRSLSPGCRLCGEGSWSCLFVNGVCNARCFHCPSEQREVGEPTTNTLVFPRPLDYAAYLRRFGFRGASMSGGEPLLTPDRTVRFLQEARAALGPAGYLWIYTNGMLVSPEILVRLAETGLDEIRFDLAAVDYDLAPLRLATLHIGTVTVEVPAAPDEAERLEALLPELRSAGVRFLNLHELRCTPHNLSRLLCRGYVFRHGPRVAVLGSELAALRIVRATLDRGIALPVNYCSSVYKALYQARAARARAGEAARAAYESLTPAGYIRELEVRASGEELGRIDGALRRSGADPVLWRLDRERLLFHPSLWQAAGEAGMLCVRYHAASLRPDVSYRAPFREVELGTGKSVFVEREPATGTLCLDKAEAGALRRLVLGDGPVEASGPLEAAFRHERLREGLLPYF